MNLNTPLGGSQHVLKAEAARPDATDREPPAPTFRLDSKPAWPLHGLTAEQLRAAERPYMEPAERRRRLAGA